MPQIAIDSHTHTHIHTLTYTTNNERKEGETAGKKKKKKDSIRQLIAASMPHLIVQLSLSFVTSVCRPWPQRKKYKLYLIFVAD